MPEHMIGRILKWVLIAMLVALVVIWFLGGGVMKIIDKAHDFHFTSLSGLLASGTSTFSFANFHLPWEMVMPQISVQAVPDYYGDGSGGSYGVTDGSVDQRPPGGLPSPYAQEVAIQNNAAQTQSAAGQYIELDAVSGSGPIDISGWSLSSAISGTRIVIPQAASLFVMGRVNAVAGIALSPGGRAIIVSGASPVGVSFRENMCTGYLGTLQPFVPPLAQQCPAPLSAIPATEGNVARLGASCFDYLRSLPPCTFPQNPPSSLSSACRAEIQNKLSYNGCLSQYKTASNFASNSWRVYLAHGAPIWGAEHDIIRLLDSDGKLVNVLNY